MFRTTRTIIPKVYKNSLRVASSQPESTTDFGFQTVPKQEKAKLVGEVFSRVASKYDLMNDVLSVGIHRLWKDTFVNQLNPRHGLKHLDVAGGTGDISFRIVEYLRSLKGPKFLARPKPASQIIVSDINPDMLGVGEDRARKLGYSIVPSPYLNGECIDTNSTDANTTTDAISGTTSGAVNLSFHVVDASNLKDFPDNTFDSYTIAFGLRNVTDKDLALREAHRVLKRGGRFMCLEFSKLDNIIAQQAYDQYSFHLMPMLGELFANDRASYQYLVESIRKFPTKPELAEKMTDAGFKNVTYDSLTFGMVAIHSGYKL